MRKSIHDAATLQGACIWSSPSIALQLTGSNFLAQLPRLFPLSSLVSMLVSAYRDTPSDALIRYPFMPPLLNLLRRGHRMP